jgi:hypothetical protein
VSGEAIFITLYAVMLLAVVGVLEIYGHQPTSAWASRVFAGYRRAVPDAPHPADQAEWPHSEVARFHRVLSLFVPTVAMVLILGELVRHHRPYETLALVTVGAAHGLLATRLIRRLRHNRDKEEARISRRDGEGPEGRAW